jgi:hypothetical protein
MGKQEGTVRGLQFRAIAALRRTLGIDETDRLAGDAVHPIAEHPARRPRVG